MKNDFKLAVAQFRPVAGDVGLNTQKHVRLIKRAIAEKADIVFFPELSLTGYELELAKTLAFSTEDGRLAVFRDLADEFGITIIVGAPLLLQGGDVGIGVLVIRPHAAVLPYCKMHLHSGEAEIFATGNEELVFDCQGESVGLAICADTANAAHAAHVAGKGATVYLCSMVITANGYAVDTQLLCDYAHQYKMLVAMANYCGETGGWPAIGKSAIWSEDGTLIGVADEGTEGLVMGMMKKGARKADFVSL